MAEQAKLPEPKAYWGKDETHGHDVLWINDKNMVDVVPLFALADVLAYGDAREAQDLADRDRLEAEVESLRIKLAIAENPLYSTRRNAARYLYLRDVAWNSGSLIFYAERYGAEDWDSHIDSAIDAQTGKGEQP